MSRFCELFSLPTTLPAERERLKELFWYLLYDDSKRMVFCYVPKVKKGPSHVVERETGVKSSVASVHGCILKRMNRCVDFAARW